MKYIAIICGITSIIYAISLPAQHDSHHCPPRNEWKGSICPTAQAMEVGMFLFIGIGAFLISLGVK